MRGIIPLCLNVPECVWKSKVTCDPGTTRATEGHDEDNEPEKLTNENKDNINPNYVHSNLQG